MEAAYEPKTLQDAIVYFSNPDNCLNYLAAKRWPNGVACPTCGSKDVIFLANQRRWKCRTKHPRQQFSIKVGTIFEDSPIGLEKWLPALWMLVNDKNGISSYEMGRALGVTQKTAWFMDHRIRLAMQTRTFRKLRGMKRWRHIPLALTTLTLLAVLAMWARSYWRLDVLSCVKDDGSPVKDDDRRLERMWRNRHTHRSQKPAT